MFLVCLDLVEEVRYTALNEERFIKWIKLIKAKDGEEMAQVAKGDQIMEETVVFVKKFLNNEEILGKYDKMNTLLSQAEDVGFTKGEKNSQLAIAKNMLEMKMPVADIHTVTGLSTSEIEALM